MHTTTSRSLALRSHSATGSPGSGPKRSITVDSCESRRIVSSATWRYSTRSCAVEDKKTFIATTRACHDLLGEGRVLLPLKLSAELKRNRHNQTDVLRPRAAVHDRGAERDLAAVDGRAEVDAAVVQHGLSESA